MKATSYIVIPAGPRVSIHTAEPVAEGFETPAAAHEHIEREGLTQVQVVAVGRRWLDQNEMLALNAAIVGERVAA